MVSARNTVSGGAGGCSRWACSEATSASNVLGLAGSRVWAAGSSYDGRLCEWAKTLVIKAIELMKCGKAAGASLNLAEMLKASGVEGPHQICDLICGYHPFWENPYWTGGEYHSLPLQGQRRRPWGGELSRPEIARPGHEGSREGGWELSTATSAHRCYAVWFHVWTQHHRHCTLPLLI